MYPACSLMVRRSTKMPLVFKSVVVPMHYNGPFRYSRVQNTPCPLNLSVSWWWEWFVRFTVRLFFNDPFETTLVLMEVDRFMSQSLLNLFHKKAMQCCIISQVSGSW